MPVVIIAFIIALSFPLTSVGEDTLPSNTTRAKGEPMYVRDYLYVPLRSGESSSHRIIHKGLKSGTAVHLLQTNAESGYSLIRLKDGTEGWLPTQYLMEDIGNDAKLRQAQGQIQSLKADLGPTGEKLLSLKNDKQSLTQALEKTTEQLTEKTKELEAIKTISAGAIKMEADYNEQRIQLENNQVTIDALNIENEQLKKSLRNQDFILGAIVLLSGMLVYAFLQWLFTRKRRRSEWR